MLTVYLIFMSKVRYGLQQLGKVRIAETDPLNKELEDIQIVHNKLVRLMNDKRLADKIVSSYHYSPVWGERL